MEHHKWPKIGQYRNVVRNVSQKIRHAGVDENEDPIFDNSKILPTLEFIGTTKLHGTNSAVCVGADGEVWYQSRKNIISIGNDNAGFAAFASHPERIDLWKKMSKDVRDSMCGNLSTTDIAIFGEWCGRGIQNGVAVSELPKMFVIFGIDITTHVDDDIFRTHLQRTDFLECVRSAITENIYSIEDFGFYEISIDFENYERSQNKLNEITEMVESKCPVGDFFGVDGVGEGVVWKCITPGFESSKFWFKVKGEKHSKTKVKKLAPVDVERFEKIKELAECLTTPRLEQISQDVFDLLNGGYFEREKIGLFIKAMMKDVFDEESDTILQSGFSGKDLSKHVGTICKQYVLTQERIQN